MSLNDLRRTPTPIRVEPGPSVTLRHDWDVNGTLTNATEENTR